MRIYVIAILLAPMVCTAETFSCNGVISNRPCSEYLTPIPRSSRTDAQVRSKKQSLAHSLTMKAIDARRTYGVEVDISEAQEVCLDSESTLEECRNVFKEIDDRIESRLAARNYEKLTQPPTPTATPPKEEDIESDSEVYIVNPWPRNRHHRPRPPIAPLPPPILRPFDPTINPGNGDININSNPNDHTKPLFPGAK